MSEGRSPSPVDAGRAGETFLQVEGVSKRYYTVQALDDVSLDLRCGEVHAVVGENGAGKTTLMRILGGEEQPDAGRLLLEGREIRLASPLEARARGIAVVHQHFPLVPAMTVAENIALGALPARMRLGPLSLLDRGRMRRQAREAMARLGVALDPDSVVALLGVAERQLLEIVKALSRRSRVLVLDEPTSSLEPAEVARLFEHMRVVTHHGTAVVFISHKVEEVLTIADRVTVLRDGRRVASESARALDAHRLVQLIVGRELGDMFQRPPAEVGDQLLRVDDMRVARGAARLSFAVRRGEILGFTGLLGSGISRLFKTLCGAGREPEGGVEVAGRRLRPAAVRRALAAGICLVPGDRHTEGLVPEMSVEDNIVLPNLARLSKHGIVIRRRCRELCLVLMRALDIRPMDPTLAVKYLSGGNQQKVVIAKWLASRAELLVMDDPTRGVDIGAKAEIHKVMGRFVAEGRGILLSSSELPEVLGMSDRIVVMHRGRIAGRFDAGAHPEAVMACATGVTVTGTERPRPEGP